mmetsp:Transcript_45814/g.129605  ORF Transcript_45814/g.129605 Transcript_45814/m.129605 type:complete len:293 (+) Transcript_45814:531-1409(+)
MSPSPAACLVTAERPVLVACMTRWRSLFSFLTTAAFTYASRRPGVRCGILLQSFWTGRNSSRHWYVHISLPLMSWALSWTATLFKQSRIVTPLNLRWAAWATRCLDWKSVAPASSRRTSRRIRGVAQLFEAVWTISLSRGMPRVTFAPPWPARWKVFRVICVLGSPMLCAAMTPTASPGCARLCMNFSRMYWAKASTSLSEHWPRPFACVRYFRSSSSCRSEVEPKKCDGVRIDWTGSNSPSAFAPPSRMPLEIAAMFWSTAGSPGESASSCFSCFAAYFTSPLRMASFAAR